MEYVAGGSLRSLVGTLGAAADLRASSRARWPGSRTRSTTASPTATSSRRTCSSRGAATSRSPTSGSRAPTTPCSQRLTSTGKAMGTPAYMAPEQALDEPLGPSTDLYALGVIVYELLAGRPPFDADTPVGVLYCHVHKPPPPLAVARAGGAARRCASGSHWLLAKAAARRARARPPGLGRARGDRGRRARALLAARRGDHGPRAGRPTSRRTTPTARRRRMSRSRRPRRRSGPPTPEPPTPAAARAPPRRRAGGSACSPPRSPRRGAIAAVACWRRSPTSPARRRAAGGAPRFRGTSMPVRLRRRRAPAARDRDARGRRRGAPARRRRGARPRSRRTCIRRGSVITESTAGVPGRPRVGRRLRLGARERRLRPRRLGRPRHRDAREGPRLGALRPPRGLPAGRRSSCRRAPGASPRAGATATRLIARDLDGDGYDDLIVPAARRPPGRGTGAVAPAVRRPRRAARDAGAGRSGRRLAGPGFGRRLRSRRRRRRRTRRHRRGRRRRRTGARSRDLLPGLRARAGALPPARRDGRDLEPRRRRRQRRPLRRHRPGRLAHGRSGSPARRRGAAVARRPCAARRGRRSRITQNTPAVPGENEPGDEFGAVVEAGDVDSDGFADMVVRRAARGRRAPARITVIRGGREGLRDARQQLVRPGRADGSRRGGARRRVRVHAHDPEPHARPPPRRRRRRAGRATPPTTA